MGKKIFFLLIIILLFSLSSTNAIQNNYRYLQNDHFKSIRTTFRQIDINKDNRISIPQCIQTLLSTSHPKPLQDFTFLPEDIILSDDAYHNTSEKLSTEWWYFDAKLKQHYTVQFSIHLYDFYDMKFITINLNIYHETDTIIQHRTMHQIDTFQILQTTPLIIKNDDILMKGSYDNKNNTFLYQISYSTHNASIDLNYQSTTKGWKGTTPAGDWAVFLPQSNVNGTITLNNQIIPVQGKGYHDHNWNVTVNAGLNFGWIWGKTNTNSYTLTWSNIMTTWFLGKPLLVVNKQQDGYYNIPADSLDISVTSVQFQNGYIIPYGFILIGETENISLFAEISIKSTDYSSVLGVINYWRYHIQTQGTLTVHNHSEKIEDDNIAEFIRFRFY